MIPRGRLRYDDTAQAAIVLSALLSVATGWPAQWNQGPWPPISPALSGLGPPCRIRGSRWRWRDSPRGPGPAAVWLAPPASVARLVAASPCVRPTGNRPAQLPPLQTAQLLAQ